jgi:hypothetical protein
MCATCDANKAFTDFHEAEKARQAIPNAWKAYHDAIAELVSLGELHPLVPTITLDGTQ